MGANPDVLWQSTTSPPSPIRCWDGDYAVYNALSGDTHVLDVVTGEVLRTVVAGRTSTREVCRRLAAFLEVPDDDGLADTVGKILNQLDELGLIEPAAGC